MHKGPFSIDVDTLGKAGSRSFFVAQRAIVDAKLAEIQRKAEFAEEMKALREAAEWERNRGRFAYGSCVVR